MIRVFIDLSDTISLMLTNGRKIACYSEFEYTTETLDQIYSTLAGIKVDEAIVVFHGVFSLAESAHGVEIKNAHVVESIEDKERLEHMFKILGIQKVFYYEYLGYCSAFTQNNTLIIDQHEEINHLMVYTDSFKYSILCSNSNLSEQVSVLHNKYGLTSFLDVKNLVSKKLLAYFSNISDVDTEIIFPKLSLFAYTMTKAAEDFLIKSSSFKQEKILLVENVADAPEKDNVINEKKPLTEDTKSKVRKREKTLKGKQHGESVDETTEDMQHDKSLTLLKKKKPRVKILGMLSTLVLFICILGIPASIAGEDLITKYVAKNVKNISSLTETYQKEQSQLNAYSRLSNKSAQSNSAGLQVLDDINFSKCKDLDVSMTATDLHLACTFKSKNESHAFANRIAENYKVKSSSFSEKGNVYNGVLDITL